MPDLINHPPHYTHGKIEPIDVIEDWKLPFHLGSALKYLARHAHKGSALADLQKARWYLDRYIKRMEKQNEILLKEQVSALSRTEAPWVR